MTPSIHEADLKGNIFRRPIQSIQSWRLLRRTTRQTKDFPCTGISLKFHCWDWDLAKNQAGKWDLGKISAGKWDLYPPSGPSFRFIVYFFPLFCIHYSKLPYTKGKGNKNFIKDKIEPQQIYHHYLYVEAQMILMTSIILFCTFDKVTQSTWRGDLRKPSGIHKCMCTPSVF